MAGTDPGGWDAYNDAQRGRAPHDLVGDVIRLAGPGDGRQALDLGCGQGIEARALTEAGYRVHAVDNEPTTATRVAETLGPLLTPLVTVEIASFAELGPLPRAHLLHAHYSLPFCPAPRFGALWSRVETAVEPGGWLAVVLFGDHDTWAGTPDMTFVTEAQARELLAGWAVQEFTVEDEDGDSFFGPKHWHTFTVIARR